MLTGDWQNEVGINFKHTAYKDHGRHWNEEDERRHREAQTKIKAFAVGRQSARKPLKYRIAAESLCTRAGYSKEFVNGYWLGVREYVGLPG